MSDDRDRIDGSGCGDLGTEQCLNLSIELRGWTRGRANLPGNRVGLSSRPMRELPADPVALMAMQDVAGIFGHGSAIAGAS